jgi:hypothetical protein
MSQKNFPNYSLYHLHELEAALKNVDELVKPDEARVIKEFIRNGGYKYPVVLSTPRPDHEVDVKDPRNYSEVVSLCTVKQVAFTSARYKFTLVFILSSLLLLNVIAWLVSRNSALFVSIAFQGGLLSMIFLKHKYTRALIKVWSSFLIAAGVTGFLSMLFYSSRSLSALIWNAICLSVGLSFLLWANRSVLLVPYPSHAPSNHVTSSIER